MTAGHNWVDLTNIWECSSCNEAVEVWEGHTPDADMKFPVYDQFNNVEYEASCLEIVQIKRHNSMVRMINEINQFDYSADELMELWKSAQIKRVLRS